MIRKDNLKLVIVEKPDLPDLREIIKWWLYEFIITVLKLYPDYNIHQLEQNINNKVNLQNFL